MTEQLKALIAELDPEIQAIVAEVINLERESLDRNEAKPRVKEAIRDVIDKYARHGMGREENNE